MRAVPSIGSYLESVAATPGEWRQFADTRAVDDPVTPKRDGAAGSPDIRGRQR